MLKKFSDIDDWYVLVAKLYYYAIFQQERILTIFYDYKSFPCFSFLSMVFNYTQRK